MNTVLTLVFFAALVYLFIQFARQEYVKDDYDDAIVDIEGRLDWARTRRSFPFGMRSQIEVCSELLEKAKRLWYENRWHQAYQVARQSQAAMDRAQKIYSSVIKTHNK